MVRGVEAVVKPELLIWARESAGFSIEDVAKKVRVKLEKIESWEVGDARPTFNQLLNLANTYKRPVAVFYLPEPPKDFQPLKDFRRLYNRPFTTASPRLIHEMRTACERREIALELYEELEDEPSTLPFETNLTDQPEELAVVIRQQLGIDRGEQKKNHVSYNALRYWKTALENVGVLLFQASRIELNEMRGFSISHLPLPVIVLNSKDHPRARCFTMLHEFVHILLQAGCLGDQWKFRASGFDQRIETFCNHVAGAVLVPKEELLGEAMVKEKAKGAYWPDEDISDLASEYGVSREVVLRRLLTIGHVTEDFYRKKRHEFVQQYEEMDTKKASTGGPPPHRKVISSVGTLFARLVLDSYNQEYITSSDLSDYLGMKLGHLGKVEDALVGQHG